MTRIPTVTLKHPVFGILKVNEADYGMNIGGWVNAGWKRVGETNVSEPIEVESVPEDAVVADPTPPTPPEPAEPAPTPHVRHSGKRGRG